MDIFEGLFKKITQSKRQKSQNKSTTVFFKDLNKYLHIILQYHSQGLTLHQIHSGLKNCGYINKDVYFPDMVDCFSDKNLNFNIYKNLALTISLIQKNNLISKIKNRSNTAHRLETLKYWNQIGIDRVIDFKISPVSVFDRSIYSIWRKIYLEKKDAHLFEDQIDNLIKQCKYNDDVPDFLFYTIPHLIIETQAEKIFNRELKISDSKVNEKKNERKDTQIHQELNAVEEDTNTIMHSFEKTETLDDYDGKKRFMDGDDELDDHLQALDEVQISQTADKQQETKSIFRSDFASSNTGSIIFNHNDLNHFSGIKNYMYPEWFFKKNEYLVNYCKIYEHSRFDSELNKEITKTEADNLYKSKVIKWERKIQNLFNVPAWIKRQPEGQDVDIDEVIRYVSSLSSGYSEYPKIYQNKKRLLKDISIVVLFDASLSTDSYIKGRRIFDVISESVNILTDIFIHVPIRIQIASTNSLTHNHINYHLIKNFSNTWDQVKYKMSCQKPAGYTRLGPAIRHATMCLKKEQSNHKLLVLMTDGKPTDMDEYEGRRGIEDIKKALKEAESLDIHTWAMALEAVEKSYFKSMFPNYSLTIDPERFTDELINLLLKMSKK